MSKTPPDYATPAGEPKTLDDIVRENATSTADETGMERIERLAPGFIDESFAAAYAGEGDNPELAAPLPPLRGAIR